MNFSKVIKLTKRWFKKDPIFLVFITAVIVLAIYLRTYNYFDRLIILADNSREAQVALYALDNNKIPQIGPWSQAPFFLVHGGIGFWKQFI